MSDPNKYKLNSPNVEGATDTGSGGFDVDGELYAYDVGLPDGEGGSKGTHSKGQIDVDQTDKDLPKPTKVTLAQYLGDLTSGKRGASYGVSNTFPVDATPQSDVSVKDEKGYPTSPSPAVNSVAFAKDLPGAYTTSYPKISEEIKKGKSSRQVPGGNELLRDAQDQTKGILGTYTSDVLKRNRFTPDTAAALNNLPQGLGTVSLPLRHKLSLGSSEGGKEITQAQLAQVGPLLTLRAGLELTSTDDGANPNSATTQGAALLPGTAQLALFKVEKQLLEARDIIDNITSEGTEKFIDIGSESWGVLNNTEDQYSGISALGMVALSTAMVAALQVAIEGLSIIFDLIKADPKKPFVDGVGRYMPGSFYGGRKASAGGNLMDSVSAIAELDFGALLGIQPTIYPFSDALRTGSRAFFGIEDDSIGEAFASFAARQFENPGFNAIIARTIVRSGGTIVAAIGNIGGSPIDVAKQILEMIEVIRSSKIIAACNIFAQLGDAILTMDKGTIDPTRPGFFVSKMDAVDDALPNASIIKSRLKNSLKLAWSGDRAYSVMLSPGNLAMAAAQATSLGSYQVTPNRGAKSNTQFVESDQSPSRFSSEVVAAFEQRLDAEYVPFYFHDLRTNEIVAFHAFLTSLTDDYSAAYETSEGIGRVDPVMIYKNTKRKISLSFIIAATSPADFDTMWAKINKLVTLVYPQYSQGKTLQNESGDYKFEQPFSQLIGASPMIRLRLGDLIKGNYSRFNLARLFGLGRPDLTLGGVSATDTTSSGQAAAITQGILDSLESGAGDTFIPNGGNFEMYVKPAEGSGMSIGGGSAPEFPVTFSPGGAIFVVKITGKKDPTAAVGECPYIGEVDFNTDNPIVSQNITALKKQYGNVVGGTYCFPATGLIPTEKTMQKIIAEVYSGDYFGDKLSDFMSPENNAIVKSFKATGGKGLAGFIDSMNFDWYDRVTWEIGPGITAPKMCKVTISYSPIHDISPGIDAFGVNRAPVYQVGGAGPMRPDTGE